MIEEDIIKYMELSIEVMKKSIHEQRNDSKPSPYVGAVLVRKEGLAITSYRGELCEGDRAEYSLIERKCKTDKLENKLA